MKVCIGGTFDCLHKAHKKLIDNALKFAGDNGFLLIGLTTNKLLKNKKIKQSYNTRKQKLIEYVNSKKNNPQTLIMPLYNKYGPSITDDFDIIVVSPNTYKTAEEINQIRIKKGLKPLKIKKIPIVLAEDKKPISSTRIRNKEIDINGIIVK